MQVIGRYVGAEKEFEAPVARLPAGGLGRATQQRLMELPGVERLIGNEANGMVDKVESAVRSVMNGMSLSGHVGPEDIVRAVAEVRNGVETGPEFVQHQALGVLETEDDGGIEEDLNFDAVRRECADIVASADCGALMAELCDFAFAEVYERIRASVPEPTPLARALPKVTGVASDVFQIESRDNEQCQSVLSVVERATPLDHIGTIAFLSGEREAGAPF